MPALPRSRSSLPRDQVVVAGGREVGVSFGDHFVDRVGDRAVLEERLFEVGDVVDQDPRPGRRQRPDVFGERRFAEEGGREIDPRPGRQVVDDLRHAPALVGGFARSRVSSSLPTGFVLPHGLPVPGRSPPSTSPAALVAAFAFSKEWERMPMTTLPSTPKAERAAAAPSWMSPSETTAPAQAAPRRSG